MPRERSHSRRRRICFVSGTRAEFGLMRSTLDAIGGHGSLDLQLIITGMHLDRTRGRSINAVRADGWRIDQTVPWPIGDSSQTAATVATGKAISSLAKAFTKLDSDVILVTGDRVEAFAAATAGHLCGKLVAHVHGGDRALGLVDDSLRHSITKLSHLHFPATQASAERIKRLGEDPWRIFKVGSPGLDGVRQCAALWPAIANEFPELTRRQFALILLHPQATDPRGESRNAKMLLQAVRASRIPQAVIIYPNNDPGSEGIVAFWDAVQEDGRTFIERDLPRPLFLGLLRESAVLVGNSSSGIIEAASFGTPVLNIGSRQSGRERGENVIDSEMQAGAIATRLREIWNDGRPIRFPTKNIYGSGGAGYKIAAILARLPLQHFAPKLIAY